MPAIDTSAQYLQLIAMQDLQKTTDSGLYMRLIRTYSEAFDIQVTSVLDSTAESRSFDITVVECPPYRAALFVLDIDEEDGSFIFSDNVGAMYGVGKTFMEAVKDWHTSGVEFYQQLSEVPGQLHFHLNDRRKLLDVVLGPELGQP